SRRPSGGPLCRPSAHSANTLPSTRGRRKTQLAHILMPVCAEHAADVFRGRIAGFEMAWRLV
ncbi:MAG TPA: hypothetical protein VIK11_00700, partial [Tepidiformaceae bacterium]